MQWDLWTMTASLPNATLPLSDDLTFLSVAEDKSSHFKPRNRLKLLTPQKQGRSLGSLSGWTQDGRPGPWGKQ